jgi:predicted Zn-dependent peptidase
MRLRLGFAAAAMCLLVSSALAQSKLPKVKFTDYRLKNGLRVILSTDRNAPVVAVSVTYNVGSRDERPGRSGFAHLFEHLMFQGSENVGRGEHFAQINDNGGTFNGTTNQDRTNYFCTLPANQLELGIFLEADRMRALDISQDNLNNQRLVVQEERRQRTDNVPYGSSFETLLEAAFTKFSYKHSTIGSMEDLNAATLQDVRDFFKTYYAPNNACIAIVGDFDLNKAKRLIEKYFGPIPSGPKPPAVDWEEPPSAQEIRKEVSDRLARMTRYAAAYKTVPGDHPDYYALSLLGSILSRGRTGRLYEPLVEKRLAFGANAGIQESRGASLFNIGAMIAPGSSVEKVEAALDHEIGRIQVDGVSAEELEKAKTQARIGSIQRFSTALSKANALTQNAIYYNDPGRLNTYTERLDKVTLEDIKRVAQKYLVKSNRVVVITKSGAPIRFPGGDFDVP